MGALPRRLRQASCDLEYPRSSGVVWTGMELVWYFGQQVCGGSNGGGSSQRACGGCVRVRPVATKYTKSSVYSRNAAAFFLFFLGPMREARRPVAESLFLSILFKSLLRPCYRPGPRPRLAFSLLFCPEFQCALDTT